MMKQHPLWNILSPLFIGVVFPMVTLNGDKSYNTPDGYGTLKGDFLNQIAHLLILVKELNTKK